ncbi:hypothetical protein IEQ34_012736 [Dendrobium chrysotoxum]|uniref:Uncharacterized protein n=1 Tax=Dendrobium chrysotoxum TaxID=161865 RepID=A0AAV7GLM9_DENCH|nr:hypothetical protein IEQ34_012736 [Dendrobium chrysotoxum]
MSLLQPNSETFNLFDDIIIINEGHILYHGPLEFVLPFFDSCGFHYPERKSISDFIQEVISCNDQEQYWADQGLPYSCISTQKLNIKHELAIPFDKSRSQYASLIASFAKEWLLIKRNLPLHINSIFDYFFIFLQIFVFAKILFSCIHLFIRFSNNANYDLEINFNDAQTNKVPYCKDPYYVIYSITLFMMTRMHTNTISDGNMYIGSLAFAIVVNVFVNQLPIFYKHRDLLLYPAWVFTIPNFVLKITISMLESIVWVVTTYYIIGFATKILQAILDTLSDVAGSLSMIIMCMLGGFILPKAALRISKKAIPNEAQVFFILLKLMGNNGKSLGMFVLENANAIPENKWYWIGVLIYVGYIFTLNVLFTLALNSLTCKL